METSKILSADLLDLLFDDRNKKYGAYELRRSYRKRMIAALLITGTAALITIGGSALARSINSNGDGGIDIKDVQLVNLAPEKEPEKLPPPEKKPEVQPPVKTEIFTVPKIVDGPVDPIVENEDLEKTKIDLVRRDGGEDSGYVAPKDPGDDKGIGEPKKDDEPKEISIVELPAKFKDGDWEKFLRKNLRAETPVDNGAPAGMYKVVMRFMVDKDGNVTEVDALSNAGFGMEKEATRVLKKAKWEPAIQNGYKTIVYHTQVIYFEVVED